MLIPVILSGGAGTRLWPVSRETHPKPFIVLPDGQSLLQKTYRRAAGLPGVTTILTVTNRDYYFRTKDEYQSCQLSVVPRFLLEPCGRNTAPAITLAAIVAEREWGGDTTLLTLPADHIVANQDAFVAAVAQAKTLAAAGRLVTFGIKPTSPETGYGYIEAGEPLAPHGCMVRRFVEKPDPTKAASYLAQGGFYWNAGIFCFRVGTYLETLAVTAPELLQAARRCWELTLFGNPTVADPVDFDHASFAAQPAISIDYAVMEKAANIAVVPCELGWSDIGSWNALGALVAADGDGNRVLGEAVLVNTHNTFVQSEHHLVAAVGVSDLIIVDTEDAVLVAHKDAAQDVRQVVGQLKRSGHEAYRLHRTVSRPWGTYTVLEEGPRFKIKRIEVKPGASLSLQMHHHRSEHWIVVSGMAKVTNGEQEVYVNANESTYIPAGRRHRLENPGLLDLVVIEVQSGEYLDEDDIVRFEDVYGRAPSVAD